MQIQAQNSNLGPEASGTPITAVNGQLVRQPPINITQVNTTVSALDGQTIVLGGLITKKQIRRPPQSALGGRFRFWDICSAMIPCPTSATNCWLS